MRLTTEMLKGNVKIQTFVGLLSALLFYKLFLYSSDSFFLSIVNESLVILTTVSLIMALSDVVHNRKSNPLGLVVNVGILNAFIFFLISFSGTILGGFSESSSASFSNPGFIFSLISFFFSFLIIGSLAYVFLVFKELYFLKQKKNVSTYFNTMIVFFILAAFTNIFMKLPEYGYIRDTFFIISILLIVINSIRISWIAFIVKKEKISLLIFSVIISVLFVLNIVRGSEVNAFTNAISQFSFGINQFFKLMMIYGGVYFSVLFFTTLFHLPTAEAFDRKAQEINFLQYFSKLITESLDFKELAETVTDITTKVCDAQASWIIWKEGNDFKSFANKNIGYYDASIITKYILLDLQRKSKKGTLVGSLNKLENGSELSEEFFNFAVAPLRAHDEVKGYLVAARKINLEFDDEDISAMDTFSDYASVAIENSRLLEESIEKERLEKELDVAREIQRKILPSRNPEFDSLRISTVFIPAFEVGGDYYDFFDIGRDRLGFVIADVSGKGISAAFIMAEVKGIFESLSKTFQNPKDILIKANEILERTLDRRTFVSAAYGVLNLKTRHLKIARAGHCPIILLRKKGIENLRPSGIGLGLNFTEHFAQTLDEMEIILEDEDTIVLYTDGITEAKNSDMEDFGSKLFEEILMKNYMQEVDEISNKVIREVTLFSQNNSQHDDITLVILKWKQNLNIDGEKEWQISTPQLKK